MKIAVISDNVDVFLRFYQVIVSKNINFDINYYCSPTSLPYFSSLDFVSLLDVESDYDKLIGHVDLIISCHSRKIFPKILVESVRCINIHPGLNPYNRGWYPQVFSINNNLPCGATIHLMDKKIDHGSIIFQKTVTAESYDTSLSLYNKIIDAEMELVEENFEALVFENYETYQASEKGNYNSISDYEMLCHIDMNKKGTFKEFYDLMRSLSHEPFMNAYFYDENGDRISLSLKVLKKNSK